MKTYTLLDLQTYIRRVIAANMQEDVWITAEVASCGEARGHWYLELLEKDTTAITAQATAVLWTTNYKQLQKKLGAETLQSMLAEGVAVRMQVRVEYHERYGMKLVVQDLDSAYTLGQLAVQRRATFLKLQEEGFLILQKKLKTPLVMQRIAVISSAGSAGYQDFMAQLQGNSYSYQYKTTLFDSAVQGSYTVGDLLHHFSTISENALDFDAICVIRGGGSRIDLAVFDDYKLAAAAAKLPLPLLVGIGHDIDESVLDAVAHQALKTPTAVADYLIERSALFETKLYQNVAQLKQTTIYYLRKTELQQTQTAQKLRYALSSNLQKKQLNLANLSVKLPAIAAQNLQKKEQQLALASQKMSLLDPQNSLKRGFSMSLYQNKPIIDAQTVPIGADIETVTATGSLQSIVQSKND